jgi:hypothetical protein
VDVVERYLLLGLRLGRLQDGLVDGFYGSEELTAVAESAEPASADALRVEAAALKQAIEESRLDAQRRRWLVAQVGALECVAGLLTGEAVDWVSTVRRCYGIEVARTPEEQFEHAQARLDTVLPGSGHLADRLERWNESQQIPPEKLLDAFAALSGELREATRRLVELPAREEIEVELVSNEPWGAYNWYLGGRRSRIQVNTDLPFRAHSFAHLVAHECYPGHHTEHACKEAHVVDELGRPEASILMIHTPECVVSEGMAQIAIEQALGESWPTRVADLFRPLGIAFDPEVAAAAQAAENAFEDVTVNVSYLARERGWGTDELVAYHRRWALTTADRAAKLVTFATHPFWGAYTPTYPVGQRLVKAFAARRPKNFLRLLTEQLTPADLES